MIRDLIIKYKNNKTALSNKEFKGYELSKSIGILYQEECFSKEKIDALKKEIQTDGKEVDMLCFTTEKTESDEVFSSKDVSFFGAIKKTYCQAFLQKPFDILFALTKEEDLIFQHLVSQSKANLKIGFSSDFYSNWLNLMFSPNEKEKSAKIELLAYIRRINP